MFPEMNATEIARKARVRIEQTRKEIVEMNNQISRIIGEAFGPKPYDKNYRYEKEQEEKRRRQHDEAQKGE